MNAQVNIMDAQAALSFVVGQRSHIETEVVRKEFPEIMYPRLIPVDTSANPYAPSVTFFSQDTVGKAKFINSKGDDIPLVDVMRTKFEQTVNEGGVGYSFSIMDIGAAQQVGTALSAEGAIAAREAYEQLVEEVAFIGNAALGVEGLTNTTGITSGAAASTFAAATPDGCLAIINTALSGIWSATKGVERANTVLVPIAVFADLATRRLGDTNTRVLDFVKEANVYTASTGLPLEIVGVHWLTTKMVVYRRDPAVLKLSMPMPLMFIPPQARGLQIDVYGVFRFAPVNIRRPGAVRYVTGVAV
jgi:hypothetical protein